MVSAKKSRSSTSSTSAAATPTKTSSDTLIDSHVSSNQAQKAFSALAAHISKRKADSESNSNVKKVLPLDSDNPSNETIYLQLTVKKLNPSKMIKPIRIPLEHSLQTSDVSVCLLVKDPQREYKDLLTTLNIKLVERVVGVSKLKGKFKAFDARRGLMNDHQLFLADDRIVPLLPKLLGKKFFDAKKQPIAVSVTRPKKLKEEIERAIGSTYYIQNKGSCSTVKIGSLALHTPSQLVENLSTSLPAIVARIPGGWSNVQGIEIKTSNSVALPIWNCKLGEVEGGRWEGMKVKELESEDDSEDDEDDLEMEGEDEVDEENVETIHISTKTSTSKSKGKAKGKGKGKDEDKKVVSSISKEAKTSKGKTSKKEEVIKAAGNGVEEKPKKKGRASAPASTSSETSSSPATKKKLTGIKKLEAASVGKSSPGAKDGAAKKVTKKRASLA